MVILEIIGIKTRLIKPGDDLLEVLISTLESQKIRLHNHDILVISEKVLALTENRIVQLNTVTPTDHAIRLGKTYRLPPELTELIIQESDMILGGIPSLILSIRENVLLANAGIVKSNTPDGWVTLLPENSFSWASKIRKTLSEKYNTDLGVIIADSRSQPLRHGLISVALGVSGIEPIINERGKLDLHQRPLRITKRAVADDLASAAQIVMGEANESIPFVIIRDAPVIFTDRRIEPDDFTIKPDVCLYFTIFRQWAEKQFQTDSG